MSRVLLLPVLVVLEQFERETVRISIGINPLHVIHLLQMSDY